MNKQLDKHVLANSCPFNETHIAKESTDIILMYLQDLGNFSFAIGALLTYTVPWLC